jgi:hypothetical protein
MTDTVTLTREQFDALFQDVIKKVPHARLSPESLQVAVSNQLFGSQGPREVWIQMSETGFVNVASPTRFKGAALFREVLGDK